MSDPAADPDARLHAALWRAVAAEGWHGLTMRRVAAEAGMAPADLRRMLPTKLDALRLHGRLVDQEVLRGTPPGQGGTARDRIFDVLMRRLDALQPPRLGLLRFLHDLRRDPLRPGRAAARQGAGRGVAGYAAGLGEGSERRSRRDHGRARPFARPR